MPYFENDADMIGAMDDHNVWGTGIQPHTLVAIADPDRIVFECETCALRFESPRVQGWAPEVGSIYFGNRPVRSELIALTEPEVNFGRIPARQELTVLSADEPGRPLLGRPIIERVGIGVFNPRGVQRLSVSVPSPVKTTVQVEPVPVVNPLTRFERDFDF